MAQSQQPWAAICRCLLSQVPLHVSTALAHAAQHKSKGVYAAAMLLQHFFAASSAQLGTQRPSRTNSLQESVLQQVEQSGLLQQLPALMTTAAVELTTQTRHMSWATNSQVMHASRMYAKHMLVILHSLCRLWPDGDRCEQGIAGSIPAAMALAQAVTRSISAEVQEHER